nr:26.5 kDa heat shock protein [Fagopyrum tataricum]
MALARLVASRLLQQSMGSKSQVGRIAPASYALINRFSSEAGGKEVAVESGDGNKKKWRSLLPRRFQRRRNHPRDDIVPSLNAVFHSGLGNALLEATQNINRLFENLTPAGMIGQIKEKDDGYKLRYKVPGLAKEDLKITINDGVLNIVGEHKEEQGDESDDEFWSSTSYGFYNTSLVLPDDAKHDDIKAELKDGVLTIFIPKDESKAKQVKEVQIQ